MALLQDLTLFADNTEVLRVPVFSGGMKPIGSEPFPKGIFTIRVDIRGIARSKDTAKDPDTGDRILKPFYGFQKIPLNIDGFDHQWEWGSMRACLNETHGETAQAYRGNYLHGKHRPDDYTHGCICDRSEKMLTNLKNMIGMDVTHIQLKVEN